MLCAAIMGLASAPAIAAAPMPATGTVQYAFTPGDRADQVIIDAILTARESVMVQAYSFTHRDIAGALIDAQRRGVSVVVIADRDTARDERNGMLPRLARAGVTVLIDGEHAMAHNKVMVIDARRPQCAVVTGSFNFTQAAQFRNAENVLVLRDDARLCEAYARNWERHRAHAVTYR
jgi:phosphatidylserine/phosphatidylglycerophosphate/cardiolipin synthase-like enzyme